MSSKVSLGINAVLFGSLALLATNAALPLRPLAVEALKSAPANPGTFGHLAAKPDTSRPRSTGSAPALKFAQADALSPTGGVLANKTADAIVPPIARRRPAGTPSSTVQTEKTTKSASTSKTAKAAPGKNPPVAKKATAVAAKANKPAAVASAAGQKPIDLSGRSALGAAPKGSKCNAGLKYDAKLLRCIAATPKAPTAARDAKPTPIARPAPIPAASEASVRP